MKESGGRSGVSLEPVRRHMNARQHPPRSPISPIILIESPDKGTADRCETHLQVPDGPSARMTPTLWKRNRCTDPILRVRGVYADAPYRSAGDVLTRQMRQQAHFGDTGKLTRNIDF